MRRSPSTPSPTLFRVIKYSMNQSERESESEGEKGREREGEGEGVCAVGR